MKYPISKVFKKYNYCSACRTIARTELHHIFGRNKEIVDEPQNLIELCVKCHKSHMNKVIFFAIIEYQVKKFGKSWLDWASETAKKTGKVKSLFLIGEWKDANNITDTTKQE